MMSLRDFIGTSQSPNFDGDRTITFEIHGFKRNVRFIGFPIRFAGSRTVHNAQGATFDAMSIARMRSQISRPDSLCVAVSRARCKDSSFFLQRISDEDISHFSHGPPLE